jgi:peptidoglycan/xylan/chitin deacetylase (PgdA/CDA1 family)
MGIIACPCSTKQVALTFDDGPSQNFLKTVFPILAKYNAKATFFVLGQYIDHHPYLVKQILKAGHEVENHTYNHYSLTDLTDPKIKEEIKKTAKLIQADGAKPLFVRPPRGEINKHVITIIQQCGYQPVLWDIDPKDWQDPSPEYIANYVLNRVGDGDIILLHEKRNTHLALQALLAGLTKKGFRCTLLKDLKKMSPRQAPVPSKITQPTLKKTKVGFLKFFIY